MADEPFTEAQQEDLEMLLVCRADTICQFIALHGGKDIKWTVDKKKLTGLITHSFSDDDHRLAVAFGPVGKLQDVSEMYNARKGEFSAPAHGGESLN